jgi:hypothetical protein
MVKLDRFGSLAAGDLAGQPERQVDARPRRRRR